MAVRRQGDRLRVSDLRPCIVAKRGSNIDLQPESARQRHSGRQTIRIVEYQHDCRRIERASTLHARRALRDCALGYRKVPHQKCDARAVTDPEELP
jgi:hypothetical protein